MLEDDLINERASYIVEKRLDQIKNNPLIKSFVEYNPYESDKKRQHKKMVIEFLFREIELYAKGYVLTDAINRVYKQKITILDDLLENYEERIAEKAISELRGSIKEQRNKRSTDHIPW